MSPRVGVCIPWRKIVRDECEDPRYVYIYHLVASIKGEQSTCNLTLQAITLVGVHTDQVSAVQSREVCSPYVYSTYVYSTYV